MVIRIYLNSYALRKLGIDRNTLAPAGGDIDKDPTTVEPTGRLTENAIQPRSQHAARRRQRRTELAALKAGQKKMNAAGITSLREPGINR